MGNAVLITVPGSGISAVILHVPCSEDLQKTVRVYRPGNVLSAIATVDNGDLRFNGPAPIYKIKAISLRDRGQHFSRFLCVIKSAERGSSCAPTVSTHISGSKIGLSEGVLSDSGNALGYGNALQRSAAIECILSYRYCAFGKRYLGYLIKSVEGKLTHVGNSFFNNNGCYLVFKVIPRHGIIAEVTHHTLARYSESTVCVAPAYAFSAFTCVPVKGISRAEGYSRSKQGNHRKHKQNAKYRFSVIHLNRPFSL